MKNLIVYIHGFGACGGGTKFSKISQRYTNENTEVISPTFSHLVHVAISQIDTIVKEHSDYNIIFVGTSLGGFYALYAHTVHGCKSILINPVTSYKQMIKFIGNNTCYDSGEEFYISGYDVEYMKAITTQILLAGSDSKPNCKVFIGSEDDELLISDSMKYFKYFPVVVEVDDHRFNRKFDIVLDSISEFIIN